MRLKCHRLIVALLWALLPPSIAVAIAQTPPSPVPDRQVAVVYPQVREPFRSVFVSIAEAARAELGEHATSIELAGDETSDSVAAMLRRQNIQTAILLGKRGLDLSSTLDTGIPLVVGAVFASPDIVPEGVRTVSLAPSPKLLFERMRQLAPKVEHVTVIHGADKNDWLIDLGREAAQDLNLRFDAIDAQNLKSAAEAYRAVLNQSQPGTDAIWLLQASSFLDEPTVLQMILREAWDRNVVVFSSNLSHVAKGALFSLYPNNAGLGRRLAQISRDPARKFRLVPIEDLDAAINTRTAQHLGLGVDASEIEKFDLKFPSR